MRAKKTIEEKQAELKEKFRIDSTKTPKTPVSKEKKRKKKAANKKSNRSISVYKRKIDALTQRLADIEAKDNGNPETLMPLFLPAWGKLALEQYILGAPVSVISKKVNETIARVNDLIDSDEGQAYIRKAAQLIDLQAVRDQYRGMWFESMKVLQDCLQSEDEDMKIPKLGVAKWFAEKSGIPVPEEVKHKHEHILKGVGELIHRTSERKRLERIKAAKQIENKEVPIDAEFEDDKGD